MSLLVPDNAPRPRGRCERNLGAHSQGWLGNHGGEAQKAIYTGPTPIVSNTSLFYPHILLTGGAFNRERNVRSLKLEEGEL
jgi:hypothetical protein